MLKKYNKYVLGIPLLIQELTKNKNKKFQLLAGGLIVLGGVFIVKNLKQKLSKMIQEITKKEWDKQRINYESHNQNYQKETRIQLIAKLTKEPCKQIQEMFIHNAVDLLIRNFTLYNQELNCGHQSISSKHIFFPNSVIPKFILYHRVCECREDTPTITSSKYYKNPLIVDNTPGWLHKYDLTVYMENPPSFVPPSYTIFLNEQEFRKGYLVGKKVCILSAFGLRLFDFKTGRIQSQ